MESYSNMYMQQIRHDLDLLCPVARRSDLLMRGVINSSLLIPPKKGPLRCNRYLTCLPVRSQCDLTFHHVYTSICYFINRAPHQLPVGFLSLDSILFIFFQLFEEKPSGEIKFTIYHYFSSLKIGNAGYLSPVGGESTHRGGRIHSVAHRGCRPSHSRQEDQARSALV